MQCRGGWTNILKSGLLSTRLRCHGARRRTVLEVALAITAFVIIPNLPYTIWLDRFAPTRALVNVDYILLGIVCIFLPGRAVGALFALLALLDAFVFVSGMYHFTPRELILSFGYAQYNPLRLYSLPLFEIVMMAIVIVVGTTMSAKAAHNRNVFIPVTLGGLLGLLLLADVCNGTSTFAPFTKLPFYSRTQYVALNPINSGVMAADITSFLSPRQPSMTHVESASQIAFRQWRGLHVNDVPNANMAVVVVESWGKFEDNSALTKFIASPLLSKEVGSRYSIKFGSVKFQGSTTNAELRELCGLKGSYRDLFNLPRFKCLPDVFTSHGYRITGMHGFRGDMFDRTSWWPLIGLRRRLFLEDFERSKYLKKCGTAFPALCDADLITLMADRLRNDRQFVYALTINSHLPLPPSPMSDGVLNCAKFPAELHNERCALAQQWRRVFNSLARNVLRSDIKPTQFVIVGDHSPPLLATAKGRFSSVRVPYIILTPRTDGGGIDPPSPQPSSRPVDF